MADAHRRWRSQPIPTLYSRATPRKIPSLPDIAHEACPRQGRVHLKGSCLWSISSAPFFPVFFPRFGRWDIRVHGRRARLPMNATHARLLLNAATHVRAIARSGPLFLSLSSLSSLSARALKRPR